MNVENLKLEMQSTLEDIKNKGGFINIDYSMEKIELNNGIKNITLLGEEALALIDLVPNNVVEEDFILYLSKGW